MFYLKCANYWMNDVPATYTIDPVRRLIRVIFTGPLNLEVLSGVARATQADAAFNPAFDTIGDFSGVTQVDLQPGDLQAIMTEMQRQDRRFGRCAMVTGEDRAMLAYAKVYQDLVEGKVKVEHRACKTMVEAETWIGLRKI